jgi:hypothetical protein
VKDQAVPTGGDVKQMKKAKDKNKKAA